MGCYPDTTDWGAFDWSSATEAQTANRELAEEFAWSLLNRLSASTIATCPVALRPNRFGHRRPLTWSPDWAYGAMNPYLTVEQLPWGECACGAHTQLWLPFMVGSVQSVVIDGVVVPPSAYRVDNGNVLVRQDGGVWPAHQDMTKPAGEQGTFVVTVSTGTAPTRLDNFAAGVLAREFLKVVAPISSSEKCRLPAGTTSIARQGTTVIIDPAIRRGMATGIPEVDHIVKLRNPHGLTQRSRVYSPDTLDRVRVTPSSTMVEDPANPGFYVMEGAV